MTEGDINSTRPIEQPHVETRDAARRLEAVTQLLDLAATTTYTRRAQAGADAAHGFLAFGIYLASCRARRLVPADHRWTNDLDGGSLDPNLAAPLGLTFDAASDKSVLQLLKHAEAEAEAEAEGRSPASSRSDPVESSKLVAEIKGLIDEAERLEC